MSVPIKKIGVLEFSYETLQYDYLNYGDPAKVKETVLNNGTVVSSITAPGRNKVVLGGEIFYLKNSTHIRNLTQVLYPMKNSIQMVEYEQFLNFHDNIAPEKYIVDDVIIRYSEMYAQRNVPQICEWRAILILNTQLGE